MRRFDTHTEHAFEDSDSDVEIENVTNVIYQERRKDFESNRVCLICFGRDTITINGKCCLCSNTNSYVDKTSKHANRLLAIKDSHQRLVAAQKVEATPLTHMRPVCSLLCYWTEEDIGNTFKAIKIVRKASLGRDIIALLDARLKILQKAGKPSMVRFFEGLERIM